MNVTLSDHFVLRGKWNKALHHERQEKEEAFKGLTHLELCSVRWQNLQSLKLEGDFVLSTLFISLETGSMVRIHFPKYYGAFLWRYLFV